jgi:hypothetical protein
VFGPAIPAAKAERIGARGRSMVAVISAGLAFQALLIVFMLLYVNVPPGFNVPYGLCLQSVALFRTLWSYPTLSLSAMTLSTAAALTVLALWGVYIAAALTLLRQRNPRLVAACIGLGIGLMLAYTKLIAV